jgi:predicted transcriptional regulator
MIYDFYGFPEDLYRVQYGCPGAPSLAQRRVASSGDIIRCNPSLGTDLRQPEVSIAMRTLSSRGWIVSSENKAETKGRPIKIYTLVKPINEIMDCIENEKREEATTQLAMVQKLREYIR